MGRRKGTTKRFKQEITKQCCEGEGERVTTKTIIEKRKNAGENAVWWAPIEKKNALFEEYYKV